jgi:hypothetical protein
MLPNAFMNAVPSVQPNLANLSAKSTAKFTAKTHLKIAHVNTP